MTLGGQTLPDPYRYDVERDYRGGVIITASGALVEDVINANAKHVWTMAFRNVTSTQRTAVETAFAAIVGASATFVDIDGNTKTVTRHESQRSITWEHSRTAGGIRYATTLVLREV
jgi:hypothetical protein